MRKDKHPLYDTWRSMVRRCTNPNHHSYQKYGGRGIKVASIWINDFWKFVQDVGERPLNHTLDRIDPNGDYAPGNVRWASPSLQTRNRTRHYRSGLAKVFKC